MDKALVEAQMRVFYQKIFDALITKGRAIPRCDICFRTVDTSRAYDVTKIFVRVFSVAPPSTVVVQISDWTKSSSIITYRRDDGRVMEVGIHTQRVNQYDFGAYQKPEIEFTTSDTTTKEIVCLWR